MRISSAIRSVGENAARMSHSCPVNGAVLNTRCRKGTYMSAAMPNSSPPRPHQRSLFEKKPTLRIDWRWVRIAKPFPTCAITIPVRVIVVAAM